MLNVVEYFLLHVNNSWYQPKRNGCGNLSFILYELDLYIHTSNVYGCGLFLSVGLNSLAQIEQLVVLLYSLHCAWVSCFIGILLVRCYLQMVALAKICYKNFSAASSLYLLAVVRSIVHHCISCRCSSHMVRVPAICLLRILMTMTHTSLLYVERFRNPHRWQMVNPVGILLL